MKYLVIVAVLAIAASFAACGSSGGSGSTVYVPGTSPATTVTSTEDPNGCSVGEVDSTTYGCLQQSTCASGSGWEPTTSTCVPGTLITQQILTGEVGNGSYFGTLSVSNQTTFQNLLQDAGLCNPYTYNYGSYACSTWTNQGGFIQLQTLGGANNITTAVTMVLGAGTAVESNLPGWSTLMPTSQSQSYISWSSQASVAAYNNNAGMQIISTYGGQTQAFRLIIPTGQFGQGTSMQATLEYQNSMFATVTLSPVQ